jgi:hypothetical protein
LTLVTKRGRRLFIVAHCASGISSPLGKLTKPRGFPGSAAPPERNAAFLLPRDLVGPILFFPLAEIREGQGSRPVARGNSIIQQEGLLLRESTAICAA